MANYKTDALKYVNTIRGCIGLEPLDKLKNGKKNDGYRCPIALSIGFGYGPVLVWPGRTIIGSDVEYGQPENVERFILRFDQGKYPDLEKIWLTIK